MALASAVAEQESGPRRRLLDPATPDKPKQAAGRQQEGKSKVDGRQRAQDWGLLAGLNPSARGGWKNNKRMWPA